jgi:hypothetical protein
MVGIVAIFAAKDHSSTHFRVPKLPMRAFTARHLCKSCGFQITYQLSYLSRHCATWDALSWRDAESSIIVDNPEPDNPFLAARRLQ